MGCGRELVIEFMCEHSEPHLTNVTSTLLLPHLRVKWGQKHVSLRRLNLLMTQETAGRDEAKFDK